MLVGEGRVAIATRGCRRRSGIHQGDPIMRLSTFVIFVGAVLLTAAPFSLHWTPRNAGLYVDNADARVVYRRGYRRSYYGYGYNSATHSRARMGDPSNRDRAVKPTHRRSASVELMA